MGLFVLFVSKHFLIKGKASLFGPNVHKDPAVEFCEDTSSLKTYASKKVLYESGVVIMARTSQRYINDFQVAGRADVEIKPVGRGLMLFTNTQTRSALAIKVVLWQLYTDSCSRSAINSTLVHIAHSIVAQRQIWCNYPKIYRPFLTKSAFLWGKL